jgi:metal-sulfur cluster biosynthetic enzyme
MVTAEIVHEALTEVQDPELFLSITSLGLVYDIRVSGELGESVAVDMTLTSPMCPVGPEFKRAVERRIGEIPEVTSVTVNLVFTPPWDPRTMADDDAKLQLGIW